MTAAQSAPDPVPAGHEQHAAWRERRLPPVERLGERLWSIPVPANPLPIRYTSCYLIGGDEGAFVLVDPGWDSPEGRDALLAGVATAGYELERLRGIIITHGHADHGGLVGFLTERTGAWFGAGEGERLGIVLPGEERDAFDASERAWLRGWGVPEEELADVAWDWARLRALNISHPVDRVLTADSAVDLPGARIRIVPTPGHTPGHICVVDEVAGAIMTGDHVLPHITPNIGIDRLDPPDRDAAAQYVDSLGVVRAWDGLLVCPAHEFRFSDLGGRLDRMLEHHAERQDEVRAVRDGLGDPTDWTVASRLHWSRGWDGLDAGNRRLALGETAGFLRHLAVSDPTGSGSAPQ
jgi:glyoxylase-like metal-dependent hydrolase (beta-lactamase superfamily II)